MTNDKQSYVSLRQYKINARRVQDANPGIKLTEAQDLEAKRLGFRDRNDAIKQLTEREKNKCAAAPGGSSPAPFSDAQRQLRQQIARLIEGQDPDEEFYNDDYPDHEDAVREFLSAAGIELGDGDIAEDVGDPYIDADGYAGVDATIRFPGLGVSVKVIAYHHRGWDFYFDNMTLDD